MLLSLPDAARMFAGLTTVVMDEVHALAGGKRGDQLALCVARLGALAPHPVAACAASGCRPPLRTRTRSPPMSAPTG